MNYTIVGLFPSQENIKEVSAGIEKSGIKNQDYIIYRTDKENAPDLKRNFWKRLFGTSKTELNNTTDHLITSVSVKNEEEFNNVTKSFNDNKVVKIYEFKDMTIDEAKDLNYIKKIVALRAKSHIYAMPEITVSPTQMN
ncbi:hypothetical protein Q73A0000_16675 [Kaistella flava (ex Peng et al. 2021)]|uniref:Uncharacterized protein n=1 Tax=Kaistella flava (ex Peng et al. 2021) TaxID=2038776 RepID=A0A7M2YDH8_9FLAO|nr:hypothetical protein [Kaistella flava (ex Peng et al. 2021)]QOW11879.1 hypothetical protein Q73A0000_16675 [Kaistella flava (ex Peng et al. 2021)]